VIALISFPFYSLPTLIIFFLLLSILSSHLKEISISERLTGSSVISRFKKGAASCILLSVSVLLFLLTRQQYKAYYTWDEAVMQYQISGYGEACKSFSEIYNPLQYNGSYLQYYGKALYLNEEYARSKTMLEQAGRFNTDDILYCSLGDCYKVCKMYNEAEEAYMHASFLVPHKLYPLYLLAILYYETGKREKALTVARLVLEKEVKVESQATEEIRMKMRKIIENANDKLYEKLLE
jgi:tetratricopeptide (TPR) repeat protein